MLINLDLKKNSIWFPYKKNYTRHLPVLDLFPVSAITGEGIEEAFDWLVSQLGSTQSKKPASGAVTQDTRNQTQKFTYGMEQCTRAFSSLKWLFMKSSSQESVTDVEEDGANATWT